MLVGADLPELVVKLDADWGHKKFSQDEIKEHSEMMDTQERFGAIFSTVSDDEQLKKMLKKVVEEHEHVRGLLVMPSA